MLSHPRTRTSVIGVVVLVAGSAWATDFRVNGHLLSPAEIETLRSTAETVLPALPAGERIEIAARGTWWSLREAVISDWNFGRLKKANQTLHGFSLCNRPDGKDQLIGPLGTCDRGRAWQVGAFAVQAYTAPKSWPTQQERIERWILNSWNANKNAPHVLKEVIELAKLSPEDTRSVTQLEPGPLRNSWLLRHPVIGLAVVVEQEVTPECFPLKGRATKPEYCYKATEQGRLYASGPEGASASLADLRRLYSELTTLR